MEHCIANTVTVAEDDCSFTIGLADHPVDPKRYLILQRSKKASEDDSGAGRHVYFELDDPANGTYGELRDVSLSRTRLDLTLASTVENLPDVIRTIVMQLDLTFAEWTSLRDGLIHGFSASV